MILIKGVKMPTDHPMWIVVHSDGTVEANEVSASRPVGWQTLRNAAVPVPPHGRLIDADAFIKRLKTELEIALPLFNTETFKEFSCEMVNAIIGELEEMPTIIPAEEVKES